MSITLTERAATEVKKIMQDQSYGDGTALRVSVSGGGCSGFQYGLNFDDKVDDEVDETYDFHGVKVVVDRKSDLYLAGTTVDFHEDINRRGFTFNNPNATKTCGCGNSFSG